MSTKLTLNTPSQKMGRDNFSAEVRNLEVLHEYGKRWVNWMWLEPSAVLRRRAYPVSFTLRLRLERLLKVLGINTCFGPMRQSILFGQQNTGRRAVGFGNHPNLNPGNTECVHGHQPESLLK